MCSLWTGSDGRLCGAVGSEWVMALGGHMQICEMQEMQLCRFSAAVSNLCRSKGVFLDFLGCVYII